MNDAVERLRNQLLALRRNNAMPLADQQRLESAVDLVLQEHARVVSDLEAGTAESLELAQDWMQRHDQCQKAPMTDERKK